MQPRAPVVDALSKQDFRKGAEVVMTQSLAPASLPARQTKLHSTLLPLLLLLLLTKQDTSKAQKAWQEETQLLHNIKGHREDD